MMSTVDKEHTWDETKIERGVASIQHPEAGSTTLIVCCSRCPAQIAKSGSTLFYRGSLQEDWRAWANIGDCKGSK